MNDFVWSSTALQAGAMRAIDRIYSTETKASEESMMPGVIYKRGIKESLTDHKLSSAQSRSFECGYVPYSVSAAAHVLTPLHASSEFHSVMSCKAPNGFVGCEWVPHS